MQITDIKVRKLFDEGPMKAIVSVTFDGQLAVHDVKVINARDKFFIVMPSRKNPDDTYRDIVHPINASFRAMLESEIIAAYQAELEAAAAAGADGIMVEVHNDPAHALCDGAQSLNLEQFRQVNKTVNTVREAIK